MAQFSLKPIIMFFVVILIGIVFLGQIEDNVSETDDIITLANNQSLTWAGNNTPIDFDDDDVVTGSVVVYNNGTKMNIAGNYSVTSSAITFSNISEIWNGTPENTHVPGQIVTDKLNASYNHEGDLFVSNTTARTFLKLLGLFFVFVLIAFAIQTMRESSDDFSFGFKKE